MTMLYSINVKTADEGGAGTDSNIFLRLIGTKGSSKEIRLNSLISGDAFERDDLDTVSLFEDNIGWVYKIQLRSDTRYSGSDWRLDYIEVTSTEMLTYFPPMVDPTTPPLTSRFVFGEWIEDKKTRTKTMAGYGLKQVGQPRNYAVNVDTAMFVNNYHGTTEIDRTTETTITNRSFLKNAVMAFESQSDTKGIGVSVSGENGLSVPVKGASVEAKRSASLSGEWKSEAVKKNESSSNSGQEHEWGEVVTVAHNVPAGVYRLSMHQLHYACGLTSYTDGIGEEALFSIAGKVGTEAEEFWDFPNDKGPVAYSDYMRFRGAYLRDANGSDGRTAAIRDFEAQAKAHGWIKGLR